MCLAIYKPAKTKPDRDAYKSGFYSNDHGAGFAAAVDGGIVVGKGFFKFDKFWAAFEPYADQAALVHFRFATHGKRNEDNCHPFMVADNLAMIHNGVLNIDTSDDDTRSDTWHYVEKVLRPLHELTSEFYRDPAVAYLGSCAIKGSKFAFLRADGDFAIWNEDDGIWEKDGHWYSNSGYKTSIVRAYRGSGFSGSITNRYDEDDDYFYSRSVPAKSSARDAFPDYKQDEDDAITDWSVEVPEGERWIADELVRFGFSQYEIEVGFRHDMGTDMHDLLMEHYEHEEDEEDKNTADEGRLFDFIKS